MKVLSQITAVNYLDPQGLWAEQPQPPSGGSGGGGAAGGESRGQEQVDIGDARNPSHGGGTYPVPFDVPTYAVSVVLANQKIDSVFSGSNCEKVLTQVLGKKIPTFGAATLREKAVWVQWVDVTNPEYGNKTQNQLLGNGQGMTLAQSMGLGTIYPLTARTMHGPNGTAVLLSRNYNSLGSVEKANVLLHELLHAVTKWSDQDMYEAFKSFGLQDTKGGSQDITSWIGTDCKSTPGGK